MSFKLCFIKKYRTLFSYVSGHPEIIINRFFGEKDYFLKYSIEIFHLCLTLLKQKVSLSRSRIVTSTSAPSKVSPSVFFQYLVNSNDSFFSKNSPRFKIYKMVCFLLTEIIFIILRYAMQLISPMSATFTHK